MIVAVINLEIHVEKYKTIESKIIPKFPKEKCQIQLKKHANFVDNPYFYNFFAIFYDRKTGNEFVSYIYNQSETFLILSLSALRRDRYGFRD